MDGIVLLVIGNSAHTPVEVFRFSLSLREGPVRTMMGGKASLSCHWETVAIPHLEDGARNCSRTAMMVFIIQSVLPGSPGSGFV